MSSNKERRYPWGTKLNDNASSHTVKPVRGMLETLSWEVLSHEAFSSELTSSDYKLCALMSHSLAEQRFISKIFKNKMTQ